jgi:hypothetical protein
MSVAQKVVPLPWQETPCSAWPRHQKAELNLADVLAELEVLRSSIKALTEASHVLKEEIVVMKCQIKSADEDREKIYKRFQLGITKALMESVDVLRANITDIQLQMKREGDERHKLNKEFQMFVTSQRETQKLDPVLPFCSTPASVAASEITTKSGTESVDAVKADTVDIQFQMQRAGEERHKLLSFITWAEEPMSSLAAMTKAFARCDDQSGIR